jgi:hypothetical protein
MNRFKKHCELRPEWGVQRMVRGAEIVLLIASRADADRQGPAGSCWRAYYRAVSKHSKSSEEAAKAAKHRASPKSGFLNTCVAIISDAARLKSFT